MLKGIYSEVPLIQILIHCQCYTPRVILGEFQIFVRLIFFLENKGQFATSVKNLARKLFS